MGVAVELEGHMVIEPGERCDSALDISTADPSTVIGQGTVITGSASITLRPPRCGSTETSVEVGYDDARGGPGLASAASLICSASVFLLSVGPLPQPSSTDRARTYLVAPLFGRPVGRPTRKGSLFEVLGSGCSGPRRFPCVQYERMIRHQP